MSTRGQPNGARQNVAAREYIHLREYIHPRGRGVNEEHRRRVSDKKSDKSIVRTTFRNSISAFRFETAALCDHGCY